MRQQPSTELMATGRDMALANTDVLDLAAGDAAVGAGQPNVLHKIHLLLKGRYPWAISLATLGLLAGATAGWLSGHQIWASNGQIRVQPVVPHVLGAGSGDDSSGIGFYDGFVDSQVAMLESQRILDNAVQNEAWRTTGRGSTPEDVDKLAKGLEVSRLKGSEMIQVTVSDPTPSITQAAVKSIISAYEKISSEQDTESGEKLLEVLQTALQVSQSEQAATRQRIMDIAKSYGTDDLQKLYDAETLELNKQKDLLDDLQLRLATMAPAGPATRETRELTIDEIGMRDAGMAALLTDRRQLERRLKLLEQDGPNRQDVKIARSELADMNHDIEERAAAVRKIIANGELTGGSSTAGLDGASAKVLKARFDAVQKLYEEKHAFLVDLGNKRLQIDALRQDEAAMKERLDLYKRRQEALSLQDKVAGRIQINSYGDRPSILRDTRIRYGAAAGFGGGALGFGLVLLVGLLDRRFRSPEELQGSLTGGPILGVLPELPDDLSDPEQAALTAHFVHQIRTLLQIWDSGVGTQVFSITSPVSGTGKTSLTLALGVSFAAADSKTLLIDCDLVGGGLTSRANAIVKRKIGRILQREGLLTDRQLDEALKLASGSRRRLGEILLELGYLKESDLDSALVTQQKGNVGLLDAINGENLDDCVTESGIPGLSILPLGGATAQHASKVTPQALRRVLAEARKRYDTILIDSGPVPGSLEASVAATEVDGVILCVSRGEQRPLADKAIQHLVSLGAKVAGVVFNRAKTTDMSLYGTAVRTSMSPTSTPQQGADSARFGPMAQAVTYSGSAESPNQSTTDSDKK